MLEAPTSVSSLKTPHIDVYRRFIGTFDSSPNPARYDPTRRRVHTTAPSYQIGTRLLFRRISRSTRPSSALSVPSYTHPHFPRSTPVPRHPNLESIEYGVQDGDPGAEMVPPRCVPDAEVLGR